MSRARGRFCPTVCTAKTPIMPAARYTDRNNVARRRDLCCMPDCMAIYNERGWNRRLMRRVVIASCVVMAIAASSSAQEPPPRIGPIVIDLHGAVPRFPHDDPGIAASRGLSIPELPGTGLGVQAAAHLY